MADELEPTTEEIQPDVEVAEAEVTDEVMAETESDATEAEVIEAEEEVGEIVPEAIGNKIPEFRAGDTLRLGLKIQEGEKTRIQYFEGIVLQRKGMGTNKTFTIRKIAAGGIAVERIFPVLSPSIVSMDVRRRGVVRRAKIYFLRDIVGSTANVIKERKVAKEMQQVQEARAAKKAVKAEKKATKPTVKKTKTTKPTTRSAKRASRKTA